MGTKLVTFRDHPVQGQPTKLGIKRQRFHCRNCGAISYERLPSMDEDFRCCGGVTPSRASTSVL
jgi:hypothetical protein